MINDDDEEVGYCNPPKSGQFKKGQSGNPKGRPKKEPPDPFFIMLQKELEKTINTKDVNGNEVSLSKKELIIKRFLHDAVNGDKRTIEILVRMAKNREDFLYL